MMNWSVEMYINKNISSHSIFSKTVTLGSSWLTDKYHSEFLGYVEGNKVFRYIETYDEENDITMDDSALLQECDSEATAIEFAKTYFSVTKVIND